MIKTDFIEKNEKLSLKTSIFYGMGELGQGMVYPMVSMFMLFFVSTYAGISPAAVGTLILIARIWDAVNDPILDTGILIMAAQSIIIRPLLTPAAQKADRVFKKHG